MSNCGAENTLALGSDVGPVLGRPCVDSDRAQKPRDGADSVGSSSQAVATVEKEAPCDRARITATGRGSETAIETQRVRQMKTVKCTTSSTSATTMHAIKGRSSAPGSCGERGGQDVAAREGNGAVPAAVVGRAIRGRFVAPGKALGDHESGTRGGGAIASLATMQEAAIGEEDTPAKRRRGMQEEKVHGLVQHAQEAAEQRPGSSGSPYWSSRQALLASLRSGVRPPEGPA